MANTQKATNSDELANVNEMIEELQLEPRIIDYSSIKSKTVLISPTEEQFELLRRRLSDRMIDSRGETIYEIGIGEDDASDQGLDQDEFDASIATLESLATCLNAECVKLRQGRADKGKITGQYLIRQRIDEKDFMEIRVAVVGNVDAGKSTLLGVLTHGELDNGRGHARQRLFRHKHEMESGRTSSVGNDILVRHSLLIISVLYLIFTLILGLRCSRSSRQSCRARPPRLGEDLRAKRKSDNVHRSGGT